MTGILADINVQGHLEILLQVWQSDAWRDIWDGLHLPVHTFASLGLVPDTSDAVLWQLCQDQQIVLLTANRNDDGPDSLEATLRSRTTATSLPVFTLADPRRIGNEASYAARTAVALLQYFLDIDTVRGTGRLYVP
jgi:hypothetical protein